MVAGESEAGQPLDRRCREPLPLCLGTGVFSTGWCRVTARRCPRSCVSQSVPRPSREAFGFCRRFLNRSSEVDAASERCPSAEGTASDPVTLRRRMLAAAAERRLQKQQTS